MDILTLGMGDDAAVMGVIFGVGGAVAVIAIVADVLGKNARHRQIENSRREIAAYIAEGSMTPEDGERILNAGPKNED